MSRLKNIVGSILNEFTQAQHLANLQATRLGREYAENDLLRYFMIPNAYADELTFSLKFAIESTDKTETVNEINYQKLVLFFSQLAVSVSETAITTMLYTAEGFTLKDSKNYRKLKEKEIALRNDFQEFLSKRLRIAFLKKGINEVDDKGYISYGKLFEIAMDVINRDFFAHPELPFTGKSGSKEIADEVKEACSSFIETLIMHSCKGVNFREEKEIELFNLILDAESLTKITPENIQQIQFKVNLRNYQINSSESEGEIIDTIIPANA